VGTGVGVGAGAGDPATAAIRFTPGAASVAVTYETAQPTQYEFIPAGSFMPAENNPARGVDNNGYGWLLTEATVDSVQVIWQAPRWMQNTHALGDVVAVPLYSCVAAGDVNWEISTLLINPNVTLTNAATTDVTATTSTAVVNRYTADAANPLTIDHAQFGVTPGTNPTSITVRRHSDTDTNNDNCTFYGLRMAVVRNMMD
jgi:hypothetical protein